MPTPPDDHADVIRKLNDAVDAVYGARCAIQRKYVYPKTDRQKRAAAAVATACSAVAAAHRQVLDLARPR